MGNMQSSDVCVVLLLRSGLFYGHHDVYVAGKGLSMLV